MPTTGAVIVAAIVFFIIALLSAAVGAKVEWVQAFVSLGAIVVALYLAVEQRFSASRIRLEDRVLLHASHRAKLHFALGRLFSYSEYNIIVLRNIVDSNLQELTLTHAILAFPSIEIREPDGDAVRDIADCISSCLEADGARALSRFIQWTQIHLARMESLAAREDRSVSELEITSRLLDSARLQGMVGCVFPYARFQTEIIDVDLTGAQIEDVLILNHILRGDPAFESVYQIIPSRAGLWRDPPF